MSTIQLRITGRVQGVCYRQSAMEMANSLALTGFVKNCSDGSVEIVVQGHSKSLDLMIAWCKKGPPPAVVDRVKVQPIKNGKIFSTFQIT